MNDVTKVIRPSVLRSTFLANGDLAWPLAKKNGISEVTFRQRLKRMTPDEAASLPLAEKALSGDALASAAAPVTDQVKALLRADPSTPDHVLDMLLAAEKNEAKAEKWERQGNHEWAANYRQTASRCLLPVVEWMSSASD